MLTTLAKEGYRFEGEIPDHLQETYLDTLDPGNLEVEMQIFQPPSRKNARCRGR